MKQTGRFRTAERLYHEALERPREERAAFLVEACAGDEALRQEVESLLGHGEGGFLEEPALDVAARGIAKETTRLLDGTRLGSYRLGGYEVLSLVGAGGMGEVYRARDTTLGREIALKLLPRGLSSDPERLGRLEREARVLGSLNHPGIATLHGLERAEGQSFLVMELVPGETLAERVHRGPLPIAEAVAVGRQMAEAIEAAHERGVVHRDLKPANVKVTPEGRVKLLDFGLAKAMEGSGSEAATAPAEGDTREGEVRGTPAYMSPEQARGQAVDRRTDVWAFGCCLYESLVGRRAFGGDSTSDTLAAVLDREPDWDALPEATPNGVRRLLRRCLTKDVRQRLQHIGDARVELGDLELGPATGAKVDAVVAGGPRFSRTSRILLTGVALGVVMTVIATSQLWRVTGGRQATTLPASPVTRFTLRLDDEAARDHRLAIGHRSVPFVLSPDGARLVVRARGPKGPRLLLRELAGFGTTALPGTERASDPFFSPDGRWVGFWRQQDHKLWKVSTSGGPPIEIGQTAAPFRALWRDDGEILLESGKLWSVPAAGGPPREIPIPDVSEVDWISLEGRIPGRDGLLVASVRDGETWFEVLSPRTGERRRLLRGGHITTARFTPTGHLVYGNGDVLFAVPMDRERFEPLGAPVPVIHGIDHGFYRSNVTLSDTGTVVYVPAERVRPARLAWLDRAGNATPVPHMDSSELDDFSVSPDGREAAVGLALGGAIPAVWILDFERGSRRLLASGAMAPIYSPDGAFVTYLSGYGVEFAYSRRRADGTGEEEPLFTHSASWSNPEDWSPDGRSLLFSAVSDRGDSDVWLYSGGRTSPLLASPFNEWSAGFSPDGRLVAFVADEGGDANVYLQPFPGPGPRTPVSIGGGRCPRWGRDGRLFFLGRERKMMVADVETAPELRVGRPRVLFETNEGWQSLQVTADGRFLAFRSRRTVEGPIELKVILNWFEELKRLAPHPLR